MQSLEFGAVQRSRTCQPATFCARRTLGPTAEYSAGVKMVDTARCDDRQRLRGRQVVRRIEQPHECLLQCKQHTGSTSRTRTTGERARPERESVMKIRYRALLADLYYPDLGIGAVGELLQRDLEQR